MRPLPLIEYLRFIFGLFMNILKAQLLTAYGIKFMHDRYGIIGNNDEGLVNGDVPAGT